MDVIESIEVVPLKRGRIQRQYSSPRTNNIFQGPLRALRLCILAITLPGLLIAIPVYLRFRVYDHQLYPIGMSDMRLIDSKISTTWCQKQLVKSNATFNAFLMQDAPTINRNAIPVSMTRHLVLSDDMKEYWGFYLLKGSTVTVSTCVRWPGASLILIRGHRHLHECAYIGDDSSEELDELMALAAEKGIDTESHTVENPSNHPDLLRKASPHVHFHDPQTKKISIDQNKINPFKTPDNSVSDDDDHRDINAKEMQRILDELNLKMDQINNKKSRTKVEIKKNGTKVTTLKEWNEQKTKHHATFDNKHMHRSPNFGGTEKDNVKFEDPKTVEIVKSRTESKNQSSSEIFQEVLMKLQQLGPRGYNVLNDLKKQMENGDRAESNFFNNLNKIDLDRNKTNVELQNKSNNQLNVDQHVAITNLLRLKRDIIIKTSLGIDLNEDDEKGNTAIEDGFVPDELADHHEIINETTLNDMSNSEFWSSFSSSEEALLNCAGLILSLPLIPHRFCEKQRKYKDFGEASLPNKITYNVPTNGYYFFVFSSENEVQENYVRVHFDLLKTVYNVSHPLDMCKNSTEPCSFPLDFFSNEKVVFEMPMNSNDSLWNQEFVVVSECEPRTSVYLICVLSVPLLILLFAFQ